MENKHKIRILLLALFLFILYFIISNNFSSDYKKSTRLYNNFGIRIPKGYLTHGIDVSHYQRGINWPLVKKMRDNGLKIEFAILKSTEGVWNVDETLKTNWKEAKENGIKRGAYLYFHPSKNGTKQAEYFIKNTPLESGDLAPVIDIEESNGLGTPAIQKSLQAAITVLKEKYKCAPIIYCNADFYTQYLKDTFDDYPLWVAHYKTAQPNIDRDWDIWQHSDDGHVNGIDGPVDFNVLKNGVLLWNRLCIP
jgi:lysozyme